MNEEVYKEISRLEAQATIRERKATEREAEAPLCVAIGRSLYYESLERAERHRKKARKMRERADQLRRYNV